MTTLYTVGHSTMDADKFRELLQSHGIQLLVDVRQFPGSRRFPHFSSAQLAASLSEIGIDYLHEVDLGGRRRAQPNSLNAYWKNASFRSYADHMAGPAFLAALPRLITESTKRLTAIMCAEAVPWRCHRWLISDALVARGLDVVHIINPKTNQAHQLNPHARVDSLDVLTYPGPIDQQAELFPPPE